MSREQQDPAGRRHVIYTDIDGTFLDARTYSDAASRPALEQALRRGVCVVFCSSKTGAEIRRLADALGFRHPYIAENGGGIYVPDRFFETSLEEFPQESGYRVMRLGTGYADLVRALHEVRDELGLALRGFSDMTPAEVADRCGFALDEARLAVARRFDEPFVAEPADAAAVARISEAFVRRGLQVTRGGRFFHITGRNDKGIAVTRLNERFCREESGIVTYGLGDSANDIPLLSSVDHAYLVQKPDGRFDPKVCDELPEIIKVPGIGPAAWGQVVHALVRDLG